jgi:hypothetical protein
MIAAAAISRVAAAARQMSRRRKRRPFGRFAFSDDLLPLASRARVG